MKKELVLNLLEDSDIKEEQNYTEQIKAIHVGRLGGIPIRIPISSKTDKISSNK